LVSEGYVYDADGALTAQTDGRSHAWTTAYDGYGRIRETADPLGDLTRTTCDDGGNPVETQRLASGGALLAKSGTTYDLLGRVSSRTDW
jgi:YD repeat-containing protein